MQSKTDTAHFDVVCLGSGEAAKYLTWHLGGEGKRCAVIEKQWIGGSCPNVACLPSKNVIHSARVAHFVAQGSRFGFAKAIESSVPDQSAVIERKNTMVVDDVGVHETLYKQANVELIRGVGRFVSRKTIAVVDDHGNERQVTGDIVVVCTGSRATIPDIPGLRAAKPMTHVELLDLEGKPEHLIILGAGYTALEFAQAMKRLGSAVTVIARSDRILAREDEDISTELLGVLKDEGISVLTSTKLISVKGTSGNHLELTTSRNGREAVVEGSHLYCGTGRIPNTDHINLEITDIKLDNKGHILVDEFCRATPDGDDIFAVGDCAGSPYFTHAGHNDFRIVRDFLSGTHTTGTPRSSRTVPAVLFTDPEFAQVGLREREARAQGVSYRLVKAAMNTFNRAIVLGETRRGFVKALLGAEDDRILGVAAVGPGAGELLPVIQLAIENGLEYGKIADLIIAHPTMSEGLGGLFGAFGPISPVATLVRGG